MAFELTERVEQDYFDDLMALYGEGWWTARRSREEVRRMLAGIDVVFGVVDTESNRLLRDALRTYPRLKDVEKFELSCKTDLIPLYEKWGGQADGDDLRFMSRTRIGQNP